jgi:hypothetical protein
MNHDIVAEQMKFAQIINLKTAKTLGHAVAARSPTRIIEITGYFETKSDALSLRVYWSDPSK